MLTRKNMNYKCTVCGQEITPREVAYIKGSVVVCIKCLPKYYIKNICQIVNRRLKGEDHPSCKYCRFYEECTRYIEEIRKSLEEK